MYRQAGRQVLSMNCEGSGEGRGEGRGREARMAVGECRRVEIADEVVAIV